MTPTDEPGFDFEVFYDGGCPLCRREINLIRHWDRRERIRFTDIAAAGFDASLIGKTQDELMARIYGRFPDGSWVQGVEVFRRLYAAVGFGPIVFLTRLPILKQFLDLGYTLFARNRLRLTGRCANGSCQIAGSPVAPKQPDCSSAN